MYQIQMQYMPGIDSIWVAKLEVDHEIYQFETEEEALAKANELQNADSQGRGYRVVYL